MKRTIIAGLLLAGLMAAEEPKTLKRETPVPEPTPAQIKALGSQLEKLAKEQAAAKPPAPAWPLPVLRLPASAHVAWEAGNNWTDATPTPGREGKVVFTFGAGLPVVVCAPLRICVIELQAGEKITAEPAIGDSVRWDVTPRIIGTAPRETVLVVVKPRFEGLDTNMVLTTDKRAYFLRLVSDKEKFVAHVSFEYPDAASAEWKKAVDTQKESAARDAAQSADVPLERHGPQNFAYECKAKQRSAEAFKPVRVWDQDGKTFIKLPESVKNREAPVLLVRSATGKEEQANWRSDGDTYVVDKLFDRAVLVLGAGKGAQRVEIIRTQKGV